MFSNNDGISILNKIKVLHWNGLAENNDAEQMASNKDAFDLKGNSGGRVARHPFSRRVTSALLRLIGRSMPVICLSEMIG
jgi:hypothetical protein